MAARVRKAQPLLALDGGKATASLNLPGTRTRTSWQLPANLDFDEWLASGQLLARMEGSLQWWLGDWWSYDGHDYGERAQTADDLDLNFGTLANYGSVARSIETSRRREVLSFTHHVEVAGLPVEEQEFWLDRAIEGKNGKAWSVNQLRGAIKQGKAFDRTRKVELEALRLGKFAVIYADPPWQYENPPMGGTNRSIENHYPTMTLNEICALAVVDIAHDDAVLFMWATSPKLYECMSVLDAWGFIYRTDMVWVKDKIGMGYYVRGKHESLLIARRGDMPPPSEDNRPDSVIEAPRLEHSAKPLVMYDTIDRMYPGIRKIELFGRAPQERSLWSTWGNQA